MGITPELGKATYVIEIDNRGFERGLKVTEAKTLKSTSNMDKSMSDMADSWDDATAATSRNTKEVDRNSKTVDKNRRSVRGFGKDLALLNQSLSLVGKGFSLLKLPVIASGISVLAAAVSQLVGGIGALAGAMGPAVGAAASLGNAYLALGEAFAVIKLASFDKLALAMKGNATAFKSLTPEAKKFGATLMGIAPIWKSLKTAVQGELFGGLTDGIQSAMQNFGRFKNALVGMAGVMGDLGAQFGKMLGSGAFGKNFSKVMGENEQIVHRLGTVLINLIPAFFSVLAAARPLTDWLTKAAVGWSENTRQAAAAGQKTGELAKFFQHTHQILSKLWAITSNFTHALINLGSIGRKTGMDLFGHMNRAAKSFRAFTESASGKNQIQEYFDNIKPGLVAMGRLLSALTKGFLDLGNAGGMKATADSLTGMVKPLTQILKIFARGTGPALAAGLTEVVKLFARLTKYTAPMLTLAFKGIGGLAKGINQLIQGNVVLRKVAVGIALVIAAMRGLAFGSWILDITGLRKAWMLLTTELFRLRLKMIAYNVQLKAQALLSAAGAKAMAGFRWAVASLSTAFSMARNSAIGLKIEMFALTAIEKVVAAFTAVKAAVLGLTFTIRGAMIATGIGALIVAAGLIVMNWDKVKTALSAVWSWIKDHSVLVGAAVTLALGPIAGLALLVATHWEGTKKVLGAVWNWMKNAAKNAFNAVKSAAMTVFNFFKSIYTKEFEILSWPYKQLWKVVKPIWGWIKQGASALWGWFKSAASTMFDVLTWPYKQAWKIIKGVWNWIKGAAKDAVSWISSHFSDSQLGHTLASAFWFVKDVAGGVFTWIVDRVGWVIKQVEKLTNVLGKVFGAGGTGSGGSGSSFFPENSLLGIFGVASGGHVVEGGVEYFAKGGPVKGKKGKSVGGPKGTDTVPAMLTPGEAVIKAASVKKLGLEAMKAINDGVLPGNIGSLTDVVKEIKAGAIKAGDALKDGMKAGFTATLADTAVWKEAIAKNIWQMAGSNEGRIHTMNEVITKNFMDGQRQAAIVTKKQQVQTSKDAKKATDDTKKQTGAMKTNTKADTGAAASSWASLGGSVDTFSMKAGKDISKHRDNTKKNMKDVNTATHASSVAWDDHQMKVANATALVTAASKKERVGVSKNMGGMVDTVLGGMQTLIDNTNGALKAFGVKPLDFTISKTGGAVSNAGAAVKGVTGKQNGGVVGLAKGAVVPGSGSGDKVPLHVGGRLAAMVEPHEYVSVANRTATAALMGVNNGIKRGVKHLANGGVARLAGGGEIVNVPVPGFPAEEANTRIMPALTGFLSKFNLWLSDAFDRDGSAGHASDEHNVYGTAADVGPNDGDWGKFGSTALPYAIGQGWTPVYYDGSYGTTAAEGHGPGHHAHVTFLTADEYNAGQSVSAGAGGAAAAGAVVEKLAALKFDGAPGPLTDMGQGILDKVRESADKYIASKAPMSSGAMMSGDGDVEAEFAKVAKALSTSKTATLALGMAGYAESGMQDLPGGDSTSQGSLQLLASTASGMGIDPHDEGAVASAFLTKGYYTRGANESAAMGLSAAASAQAAQGSAFSDGSNYQAQEGPAKAWMQKYGLREGGLVPGLKNGGGVPQFDPEGGHSDINNAVDANAKAIRKATNRASTAAAAGKSKIEKRSINDLLDKLELGGIDPSLTKDLGGLEHSLLKYEDYAQRASDITSGQYQIPDPNSADPSNPDWIDPPPAVYKGFTEAGWLTKKLGALWEMRNKLIRAKDQMEKRAKEIERTTRQTQQVWKAALERVASMKAVLAEPGKTPKDWKGLDPSVDGVGEWNAQKDSVRLKKKSAFDKDGGKLPGDRKWLEDATLASSRTMPGAFPDPTPFQFKADLLAQTVLPKLAGELRDTNAALPEAWRSLSDIQGENSPMNIIKSFDDALIEARFGGDLLTTEQQIKALNAPVHGTDPGNNGADDPTALMELYKQLALEATQRATVSQAQYPVFRDFFAEGIAGPALPFGGVFHKGLDAGPVPGRRGEDVHIIAQAGEVVAQPDQIATSSGWDASNLPTPKVIIEDGAVDASRIRAIWGEEAAGSISAARRRIKA